MGQGKQSPQKHAFFNENYNTILSEQGKANFVFSAHSLAVYLDQLNQSVVCQKCGKNMSVPLLECRLFPKYMCHHLRQTNLVRPLQKKAFVSFDNSCSNNKS